MTEKVNSGRLGSTAATVGVVTYDVIGGVTHPRGLSLSPSNELSIPPLIAFIRPPQLKL